MDLNEVFEEAYQLHDQVKQSKEYRQLKEAEKQMFQNQELSAIFFRYRQIQENLSSFPSQEEIKHLHELKMSIDEHPLVKNYKEQYQIFKVKIEELKNIIFDEILTKDDIWTVFKASNDTLKK